jgi:glycosyltransferase involved in cell wall biosynthesis
VIIPAYNEELWLGETLDAVSAASLRLVDAGFLPSEVIVVDNLSTDATADVARRGGVRVVPAPAPGIAAARNVGARAASSERLFFLDADTLIPPDALVKIVSAMDRPGCVGGAPATEYRYRKRILRPYMEFWRLVARVFRMAQGVGQFAAAEAFVALGGYDETLHMAEDTDFYWRLQRYAATEGGHVRYLAEVTIIPSSRRLDQWPIWKTVLYTNPITTRMLARSRRFWRGWREGAVR